VELGVLVFRPHMYMYVHKRAYEHDNVVVNS